MIVVLAWKLVLPLMWVLPLLLRRAQKQEAPLNLRLAPSWPTVQQLLHCYQAGWLLAAALAVQLLDALHHWGGARHHMAEQSDLKGPVAYVGPHV